MDIQLAGSAHKHESTFNLTNFHGAELATLVSQLTHAAEQNPGVPQACDLGQYREGVDSMIAAIAVMELQGQFRAIERDLGRALLADVSITIMTQSCLMKSGTPSFLNNNEGYSDDMQRGTNYYLYAVMYPENIGI
jgi:hypothetical protein